MRHGIVRAIANLSGVLPIVVMSEHLNIWWMVPAIVVVSLLNFIDGRCSQ